MAQLPEGITELLHHEQLEVPLIKCHNVIILNATNVTELDEQWDCLIKLTKSQGLLELAEPFVSKCLETTLFDVEVAQPLSKLCLQFPDIYIGSITGRSSCRSIVQELPSSVSTVPPDSALISHLSPPHNPSALGDTPVTPSALAPHIRRRQTVRPHYDPTHLATATRQLLRFLVQSSSRSQGATRLVVSCGSLMEQPATPRKNSGRSNGFSGG
nr:FAD synthase isoform X1 [Ipomoea batatas]GME08314.1 FAD synthase isoform X1 [Ipomoea batatas]